MNRSSAIAHIVAVLALAAISTPLQAGQIITLPEGITFDCEGPPESKPIWEQQLTAMVPGLKPMVDAGMASWSDYFPQCQLIETAIPSQDQPIPAARVSETASTTDETDWLCPVDHPFFGQSDVIEMTAATSTGQDTLRSAGCKLKDEIVLDMAALSSESAQWDCRFVKQRHLPTLERENDARLYAISGCRVIEINPEDWACPLSVTFENEAAFRAMSLQDLADRGCKEYDQIDISHLSLSDTDAYWRCQSGNYATGLDDKRLLISDCVFIKGAIARVEQKLATVDETFRDADGKFVTFNAEERSYLPAELAAAYHEAKAQEDQRLAASRSKERRAQLLADRQAELKAQLENVCFNRVKYGLPHTVVASSRDAQGIPTESVYRYEDSESFFWSVYMLCVVLTERADIHFSQQSAYVGEQFSRFVDIAREASSGPSQESIQRFVERHLIDAAVRYVFEYQDLLTLPEQTLLGNPSFSNVLGVPQLLTREPGEVARMIASLRAQFEAGDSLKGRQLIAYYDLVGQPEKAREVIEWGASLGDYHTSVLLSYILADEGNIQAAIDLIEPFTQYVSARLVLGYLHYASAQYDEAFRHFVVAYEDGSIDAREMVIRMLYLGQGVTQNQYAALVLAYEADKHGSTYGTGLTGLSSVEYPTFGDTPAQAMRILMNTFAFIPPRLADDRRTTTGDRGLLDADHFGLPYRQFYDIRVDGQLYPVVTSWKAWRFGADLHQESARNALRLDYVYRVPNTVMPLFTDHWGWSGRALDDLLCLPSETCEVNPLSFYDPDGSGPQPNQLAYFSAMDDWRGRTTRFQTRVNAMSSEIKDFYSYVSSDPFILSRTDWSQTRIYDIDALMSLTSDQSIAEAGIDRGSVMRLIKTIPGLEDIVNPLPPQDGVTMCHDRGSAGHICGVYQRPDAYFFTPQ